MSLKSLFKKIRKALPVILANAPALVAAFKEVKQALKTPKADEEEAAPPADAAA